MEDIINEIKIRGAMMDTYADIMEYLAGRVKWYQHPETIVNEETGELVDDTGESDVLHLAALRNVRKSILKLAGV